MHGCVFSVRILEIIYTQIRLDYNWTFRALKEVAVSAF